ncbi:hypothetical protein D3H39_27515, partial [Citrobacter portucalensis]
YVYKTQLQDGRNVVWQIPIAVSENSMSPNTSLLEMLLKPAGKVTVRQTDGLDYLNKHLRKLHLSTRKLQ